MRTRTNRSQPRSIKAALAALLLVGALPVGAFAHAERDAEFPDGTGKVPSYRPMVADPHLVVCKRSSRKRIAKIKDADLRAINKDLLSECDFKNIQDAVNGLQEAGSTIYVLPGVYREKPSRARPECAGEAGGGDEQGAPILTYKEQLLCPHAQNLIGIFGDVNPDDDERKCDGVACDLQLEGTGDDPGDVRIVGGFTKDGQWAKLNGIRADRADGSYFKNFTIELFEFNALYILEQDGFVIDDVVARYNDEYGYLTFAVDHGLYVDCEAYGNGDSGVYPGSASDVNSESQETGPLDRWAVEIKNCKSHHNTLGYSGTAGNSVYAHDNRFYKNSAGIATDSLFPNHPGLPQDHGWFSNNLIYSNNSNYYEEYVSSGICDKPPAERGYEKGAVCPVVLVPVGTAMLIAGGNYNYVEHNRAWDNWRYGFMLFAVPAALREEDDPNKSFDTSHFNHYVANLLGMTPGGEVDLNGLDFWWDDGGEGNCWEENIGPEDGAPTSDTAYPGGLPDCVSGGSILQTPNPAKSGTIVSCAAYDRSDPDLREPPGCDWYVTPEEP